MSGKISRNNELTVFSIMITLSKARKKIASRYHLMEMENGRKNSLQKQMENMNSEPSIRVRMENLLSHHEISMFQVMIMSNGIMETIPRLISRAKNQCSK
jgi:hypothetical protein